MAREGKPGGKSGKARNNWWTEIWLGRLDGVVDPEALTPARKMARKVEIKVSPGVLRGKVVYASKPNIRAEFRFPRLEPKGRKAMAQYIGEDPVLVTALVHGEFPRDLWDTLEAKGVVLVPGFMESMGDGECSYREKYYWEFHVDCNPPCTHQLAVWLAAASAINGDPFLLLELFGVDREAVLEASRTAGTTDAARQQAGTMDERAIRDFWMGDPSSTEGFHELLAAEWTGGFRLTEALAVVGDMEDQKQYPVFKRLLLDAALAASGEMKQWKPQDTGHPGRS